MKSMLSLTLILAISTPPIISAVVTSEDYQRTVILIQKQVAFGQFVFIRGGIAHERREGCTEDAATSACAIPIRHNVVGTPNDIYNSWSSGDTKLDWYGAESGQGESNGTAALGTPLIWTTNDDSYAQTVSSDGYGYTPLNAFGEHYWMADIDMDCSKTDAGWFEFKAIDPNGVWESDISQVETCEGDAGLSRPYSSQNHLAKCGYLNAFVFNSNACHIDSLSE